MVMEHILYDYRSFKCIKISFYGLDFFFANVQLKRMYILLLLGRMFFYKCKIFFDGVQILCILRIQLRSMLWICFFYPLSVFYSRTVPSLLNFHGVDDGKPGFCSMSRFHRSACSLSAGGLYIGPLFLCFL